MGEWTGGDRGECPAIRELKAALLEAIPLLAASPAKIGTIRHDGSRHHGGLAMDIMLDSRDPAEKAAADQIVDALVAMHPMMKWADLIYTDWKGNKPSHFHIPGMPPFGGPKGMHKKNPTSKQLGEDHINHIHIDWWNGNPTKWPAHASTRGFKTGLVAQLRQPPKWLVDYMATQR